MTEFTKEHAEVFDLIRECVLDGNNVPSPRIISRRLGINRVEVREILRDLEGAEIISIPCYGSGAGWETDYTAALRCLGEYV